MNQAKTKFRYIYAGIMLAAVLAVAGGCGGEIIPKPQEEDTSVRIGYKEGDMVLVQITTPESAALSVVPDDVKSRVNFWEVVFQGADKTTYYRGWGTPAARNGIDVSVPIGNNYTVLLLGGDSKTKTLLAAGAPRADDGTTLVTTNILPNTVNRVVITLEKVAIQWTGDNLNIGESVPAEAAAAAEAAEAAAAAVKTAVDAIKVEIDAAVAATDTGVTATKIGAAATAAGDAVTAAAAAGAAVKAAIAAAKTAVDAAKTAVDASAADIEYKAIVAANATAAAAALATRIATAAAAKAAAEADDFAFSGTIGGTAVSSTTDPATAITVANKVVAFGRPDAKTLITAADTLTVTVNLSKMKVLQEVDINGKTASFFTVDSSSYISLRQRLDDVVIVKTLFNDPAPTTIRNISIAPGGQSFELTPGLPQSVDISTVQDVVLKYRAFGREGGGTLWNITNGFSHAADSSLEDGSALFGETVLNGGILVRFGNGSSETGDDEMSIIIEGSGL
jgi:hypothetical protein